MKFRTEITAEPLRTPIGYGDRLLLLGSCFAAEMARRLSAAKFRTACNPTGTLFNPASIAALVRRAASGTPPRADELHRSADGCRFHYGTGTLFDSPDPEAALNGIRDALALCGRELARCDRLVVTFGTAWVYVLRTTGEIVANCHRQPQSEFVRRRLTVQEIVDEWSELLEPTLRDKRIILTVSPIRHLADGLPGNAASKAVLRLAAEELAERFDRAEYFPAFELLTDDLRDYRFYAEDLVHPSAQAVEYVWEKFAATAFTAQTRERLAAVEEIVRTARHVPRRPDSDAYRALCRRTLERIAALEREAGIDFSEETARLSAHL